jgi:hypothetical protein
MLRSDLGGYRRSVMSAGPGASGTIADVFPSMPSDGGREPGRSTTSGVYGTGPVDAPAGSRSAGHASAGRDPVRREDPDPQEVQDHDEIEVVVVPVRRKLSVAIGGFAGLLAVGLILGAQTSGPDARTPYAIVIFGVQLLYTLAWTMAMRPPALKTVAGIAVAAGLVADVAVVTNDSASLWPLVGIVAVGLALAFLGQVLRSADRARITETLGSTFFIVSGVVAFASLIALTRRPVGTQAVLVFLAATGVALVTARFIDAVFAKPRIAPQVPRGGTGIVVGAMLGTLAAAGLGSVLVLPFNPAKGAVLGLVAAGAAGLIDLAVNYGEAGRSMAGEAPTLWVARHMQGPLGAFAFAAPVAYVMAELFLS